MATAVGIDLGTTNSVIAATEAGKPTAIPNAEGSRTTLSGLTAELQQVYHGLGAAASAASAASGASARLDQQPGAPQGGGSDDVIDAEFTAHE
jgi:molecular chaperone DnaK (HSP70)